MKFFLLVILLALLTNQLPAQKATTNPNAIKDTTKKSIKAVASGKIGGATVQINYYSPAVRGRIIWGGLVPYNEVWVTGAHSATNIQINKPFKIAGKKIEPGQYAIFTIPGKTEWTFILNKNYLQHLTDEYDMKDDLVRIQVKALPMAQSLERLQYVIENSKIIIKWEKIKLEVPISVMK